MPTGIEPVLLLGSSLWLYKYGEVWKQIREDFIDVDRYKATMAVEGDDLIKMPKTVGLGLIEIATIVDHVCPDIMLTVADRYETLATATVAAYCNIPLIHLQGGEISGTIDDKVRNTITQLADYHFPATYEAHRRVRKMLCKGNAMPGDDVQTTEPDTNIWNHGCPSMDLMVGMPGGKMQFLRECRSSNAPTKDYEETHEYVMRQAFETLNNHGHGDILDGTEPYIMVMLHPDTVNPISQSQIDNFMAMLDAKISYQKIIFWNNIDPGGEVISREFRISESGFWGSKVRFIKHVEPEIFGALLYNCSLLIGNSSAGIREATFMGTPSISIGQRQEGREHGDNVRIMRWQLKDIRHAITEMLDHPKKPSNKYGDGNAGLHIALTIGEIANNV